ncbi:MAG: 4-(cytidine 5'-diphospho)-2-C-methyl-D-erythritol kinase [Bacteroidales bacterium]|nr:4-(cytidine 5'-diphospho)-2-C-methyl-D-erythritol kinase [Bacteroidales bacterium]
MIRFPNAKINLGLNIVSKRTDGYHNLETIFYPIGLKDALEVVLSKDENDSFHNSGITVDGPSDKNLVMKSLKLMREIVPIPPIDVYLHKAIPFGAGLGGGSADAATMLLMLNDKFKLGLDQSILLKISAELGADCAFFIENRPMFATGIGNVFEKIEFSLRGYHLVLIKPAIHVSTPTAYSMVVPQQPEISLLEIIERPISEWQTLMKNDFETSVFAKFPIIESIKNQLIDRGALYASMSGSGSSVFGLFKDSQPLMLTDFPDCIVWQEELQ